MKFYRKYLQEGYRFWRERLRVFFAEVSLVYTSPVNPPLHAGTQSQKAEEPHDVRQYSKPVQRQTGGFTPGFGNRLAI